MCYYSKSSPSFRQNRKIRNYTKNKLSFPPEQVVVTTVHLVLRDATSLAHHFLSDFR